jgi:hypothetical protein
MRLNEIEGNTREEILERLNQARRVMRWYANTISPSFELINLVSDYYNLINADS